MINIRKDLIEEELKDTEELRGLKFKHFKLSRKKIDRILNQYYCHVFTEHFYDSEPNIPDDIYDKYFDYAFGYNDIDCSIEEKRDAYNYVINAMKEYKDSDIRIKFCNWIEPHFKSNWGMTQETVDRVAKDSLKSILKSNVPNKERLYAAKDEDYLYVYFYGRDIWEVDCWFIFKKRKKHK